MREVSPAQASRLLDERIRTHFPTFVKKVFTTLNPDTELQWNWHLDAMCAYLGAVEAGAIRRLIINVPPRSLKSIMVTVAWPAWLLGQNPSESIIAASYSSDLSKKHSVECRVILESEWYQRIFPDTRISSDQNEKDKYVLTKRGQRVATSVGGSITGDGGNFLVLDDPLKPDEATSPAVRKSTNTWVRQTFMTRFNDKNTGKFVLVMQRLHEDDVTGNLMEDGMYTHLKLPAEFSEAVTVGLPGGHQWKIEPGALLDEKRLGLEVLEQERVTLGEVGYAGQYLQDPAPADGGIVKRDWFQLVEDKPNGFDAIVHSWDTAFKKSAGSDFSVCGVWGIRHDGYYLLEIFKRKMEYPELKKQVIRLYERDLPRYILVEDKASGQSILQDLGNMRGVPVLGIIPEMDKVWRMSSCTDVIETKKVKLLAGEAWVEDYLDEMCIFPNGRHDDQVDQTSQFLRWAKQNFDRLIENGNVLQEGNDMDYYDDSHMYTGRSQISGY